MQTNLLVTGERGAQGNLNTMLPEKGSDVLPVCVHTGYNGLLLTCQGDGQFRCTSQYQGLVFL